jgi:hypothetical protein
VRQPGTSVDAHVSMRTWRSSSSHHIDSPSPRDCRHLIPLPRIKHPVTRVQGPWLISVIPGRDRPQEPRLHPAEEQTMSANAPTGGPESTGCQRTVTSLSQWRATISYHSSASGLLGQTEPVLARSFRRCSRCGVGQPSGRGWPRHRALRCNDRRRAPFRSEGHGGRRDSKGCSSITPRCPSRCTQ